MVASCQTHGSKHWICGKTVSATSEDKLFMLRSLFQRGTANGLQGLRKLNSDEIKEIESHASASALSAQFNLPGAGQEVSLPWQPLHPTDPQLCRGWAECSACFRA
jgi:L-2-hydroxyglutarate oxidase LhgO